MKRDYDCYMAMLQLTLSEASPGAVMQCGPELGACLFDGIPVWFDIASGKEHISQFERSAWNGAAWDGETVAQTWAIFSPPKFIFGSEHDADAINSTMPIIDAAAISSRIEDLEIAESDRSLAIAQRHELDELRKLVEQLSGINSDEYFVPNLYRADEQLLPGPCVEYRWVSFDGVSYIAISTAES